MIYYLWYLNENMGCEGLSLRKFLKTLVLYSTVKFTASSKKCFLISRNLVAVIMKVYLPRFYLNIPHYLKLNQVQIRVS